MKPGEPFDSSKLRKSMEKIYNLGFFEDYPTYDILPGFDDNKERLIFRVRERATGNISLGAGYSTLDGLTGNLGVTENNFLGNGQRIGIMAEFGARRRNYEISFLEPWFLGNPTSVGFSIYDLLRNSYDNNYTEERLGGNITVGQPLGNYEESNTKLWFTYKYESVNIFDVKDAASDAIKQQAGKRDTSSLTTTIVYDTRDSIFFNTKKGVRYSASFEYAGGILGGNINFTKEILDARWFQTLFGDFVFALHTSGGYVSGYGSTPGVPIYERFFMGGTDTIRGYDERRVGPKDVLDTPLGGRVMGYGNLELRFPIIGPLMGVMFSDAGGTWDRTDEINYKDLATSVGFGLRFTITGALMLRLDYGYGFKQEWAAPGGRLHFNMGNIF
jgi:outer membrane protein insertion porin family